MPEQIVKQMNITPIIGNGFDIGILNGIGKDKTQLTTFSNFYDWLTERHFESTNRIFSEMKNKKENEIDDWSDVELIISDQIKNLDNTEIKDEEVKDVLYDIEVMREQLSLFINEFVKPEDLIRISKLSKNNKLGEKTFKSFAADLTYPLPNLNTYWGKHYIQYNWNFLNLNYTSILENYFWNTFNPHPFKTSENNFRLQPYPAKRPDWVPLVQLNFNFYHPHGIQDVAESILLGTTFEEVNLNEAWRYKKEYIGDLKNKYAQIMDETQLFIIYGSSLGESDKFWWNWIVQKMAEDSKVELIIYLFGEELCDEESVLQSFIDVSGVDISLSKLKRQTRIVIFSDDTPLKYGFIMK